MSFRLEEEPVNMLTELFDVPNSEARNSLSSMLALPSTGEERRAIRKEPSAILPRMALLDDLGLTRTLRRITPSLAEAIRLFEKSVLLHWSGLVDKHDGNIIPYLVDEPAGMADQFLGVCPVFELTLALGTRQNGQQPLIKHDHLLFRVPYYFLLR